MHVAIGTSLGVMILTALSSAWAHFLKKGIEWTFLRAYAPGIIGGTLVGAFIADSLPSRTLTQFFSAYIFCFGIYFILAGTKKQTPYLVEKQGKMPNSYLSLIIGLCGGTICSVLGVGGAPVTIPFMMSHGFPLKRAISTSALVSLLVGTIGSLSYLYFGLNGHASGEKAGYLYLPGVLITGIVSMLSAPLGARLAYQLPAPLLRMIFGIFLVVVALLLNR